MQKGRASPTYRCAMATDLRQHIKSGVVESEKGTKQTVKKEKDGGETETKREEPCRRIYAKNIKNEGRFGKERK